MDEVFEVLVFPLSSDQPDPAMWNRFQGGDRRMAVRRFRVVDIPNPLACPDFLESMRKTDGVMEQGQRLMPTHTREVQSGDGGQQVVHFVRVEMGSVHPFAPPLAGPSPFQPISGERESFPGRIQVTAKPKESGACLLKDGVRVEVLMQQEDILDQLVFGNPSLGLDVVIE